MQNWLRGFLIDRKFCVRNGKSESARYSSPSGVSQGSVLGSLLFVVYVNGRLGQLCSPSFMYADDIKVWRTIESVNDPNSLQADLNNLGGHLGSSGQHRKVCYPALEEC
ncbi:unnamed protein product [Echinostoma caproni]|uniref:Reverse transcriptase domain-containing protein n=1 Tax=Echinostoma caproni TaxID=27848 RepID=A0A183B871_9TREM|nr:unnamed protein product [Echinostoma caproni]